MEIFSRDLPYFKDAVGFQYKFGALYEDPANALSDEQDDDGQQDDTNKVKKGKGKKKKKKKDDMEVNLELVQEDPEEIERKRIAELRALREIQIRYPDPNQKIFQENTGVKRRWRRQDLLQTTAG